MAETSLAEMKDLGASAPALRAPSRHWLVRWLFVALGSLLVGVGILGIFLPLLPSTVFFLMAAGCYGKSSPGAYRWLTTNRWFGRHLRDYREERGATVAAKAYSIGSLWLGIGFTEYFFIDNLWVRLTLLAVAIAVSLHLFALRTIRR
ncbi:MAG: YbaN family protein [Chloroflexi bacterium]|nr:YbaN family protein [Chloroflexota bacterium]MCZ7577483.1 YbaN family protein [Dehalococcoidia bacterium]